MSLVQYTTVYNFIFLPAAICSLAISYISNVLPVPAFAEMQKNIKGDSVNSLWISSLIFCCALVKKYSPVTNCSVELNGEIK